MDAARLLIEESHKFAPCLILNPPVPDDATTQSDAIALSKVNGWDFAGFGENR
jgi:hypothetical protein